MNTQVLLPGMRLGLLGARWGVACGASRAALRAHRRVRAAGTAWRTLGRGVRRFARAAEGVRRHDSLLMSSSSGKTPCAALSEDAVRRPPGTNTTWRSWKPDHDLEMRGEANESGPNRRVRSVDAEIVAKQRGAPLRQKYSRPNEFNVRRNDPLRQLHANRQLIVRSRLAPHRE